MLRSLLFAAQQLLSRFEGICAASLPVAQQQSILGLRHALVRAAHHRGNVQQEGVSVFEGVIERHGGRGRVAGIGRGGTQNPF